MLVQGSRRYIKAKIILLLTHIIWAKLKNGSKIRSGRLDLALDSLRGSDSGAAALAVSPVVGPCCHSSQKKKKIVRNRRMKKNERRLEAMRLKKEKIRREI